MTYQKKVENLYDLHPAGILVYNKCLHRSSPANLTTPGRARRVYLAGDGQASWSAATNT